MAAAAAAAVRFHLLHLLLLVLFFVSSAMSISDTDALIRLKQSFLNAGALDSWDPNTAPCAKNNQWKGVVCMKGILTGIRLASMGLSGKIDVDALDSLPGLRSVSFWNNSFSGNIPEFNKLGALKSLFLSSNKFSGDIPSNFFSSMTSLKKVWLSGNMFSGRIPESLAQLPHLLELHLESNRFTGPIPLFGDNSLTSLDLSNNQLEGEIPQGLSKFRSDSFQGNDRLCGKVLNKECQPAESIPLEATASDSSPTSAGAPPPNASPAMSPAAMGGIAIVGMMLLFLVITIVKRRRDNDFDLLEKDNLDDLIEVSVSGGSTNRSNAGSSNYNRRASGSSRRGGGGGVGSTRGKLAAMGELVMVNDEKGVFGLPDLMKAAAEVLGNGGLGSAYKAAMVSGVSVVVKRMREMNRLGKDGFDAEMRHLGKLRHENILTPLAYHYLKEEKLLISEYVPKGSLLYVLHGDRGASHSELKWPVRLKIIRGIAQGLDYLHSEYASSDIPHGNLKSCNVLLGSNYDPLLSDYGFYPLINSAQAAQALFALKTPEYIQYQQVSPKSDIYCLGIIILEIVTGKFPSQYLLNGKGGTDVVHWVHTAISEQRESELIDPEIANSSSESVSDVEMLLRIGAECTHTNPDKRPSLNQIISRVEEVKA
uniref:Protein kinase domain-containing protein n=1 Tax=Kalanchoe fedtschenkoi TaxID=63787 RepID=A0A7N0UZR5_KALFE